MAIFWKICVVVTLAVCSQGFAQNKKMALAGGWRDINENDEHGQEALQYAKEEYNKDNKDGYITRISKIIRLRRQVVAGMKYSIEVEALVSRCSENEFTAEECQNQKTTKQRCFFEVVVVPWMNQRELRKGYCSKN
ncbi:cystatin-like [Phyllobates terribilis]|uniref:cystatin-like n=1 Tax=Phyllobates terribilis TaxID=111132 RepID=UPI003CCB44DB